MNGFGLLKPVCGYLPLTLEVEDSSVNVLKMLMVVVKVYNVDDAIPEGSTALLGTRKP